LRAFVGGSLWIGLFDWRLAGGHSVFRSKSG
jgi:hypothetical protein